MNTLALWSGSASVGPIANVAAGSELVSGTTPFFRVLPAIHVEDYIADVVSGTPDNTIGFQNAINAACPGQGTAGVHQAGTLILPNPSRIKINSVTANNCAGLTIDGQAAQGGGTLQSSGGNATLVSATGAGPMIQLLQTRDSTIKNLSIYDYTGISHDVIQYDQPISGVTNISTNNRMENVAITGYGPHVAGWVGIDLCPTANANCENFHADRIYVACGQSGAGASDSGYGIVQYAGQPYSNELHNITTINCSRGIYVHLADVLEINGGAPDGNYTDFYQNNGVGVTYKKVRSEQSTAPIVIVAGNTSIEENAWGAYAALGTTVSITNQSHIRMIGNQWEDGSGNPVTPVAAVYGNGATINSQDNRYDGSGRCPVWTNFASATSTGDVGCSAGPQFYGATTTPRVGTLLSGFDSGAGTAQPSALLDFQNGIPGYADDTYLGVTSKNSSPNSGKYDTFFFSHPGQYLGNTQLSIALPPVLGGLQTTVLPTPAAPTITTSGRGGSSNAWGYELTQWDAYGHTVASAQVLSTVSNATLSGLNCNNINWYESGAGAYYYAVRRTAHGTSPTTLGIIGQPVWPSSNTEYGYTLQDCGLAGDASSAEATNTTGNLSVAGVTSTAGITSTGTVDFSGSSLMKGRSATSASAITATNGEFVYDATNFMWKNFQNSVDSFWFGGPVSGTYVDNDCVDFSVVAGLITLEDSGLPCGGGGGALPAGPTNAIQTKIGRASCRERV